MRYSHFIIFSIIILFLLNSSSFAQSGDPVVPNLKSSLQINFINEVAAYYILPVNGSLSLRSGLSFNWNYNENKDGEGQSKSKSSFQINPSEESSASNSINNLYNLTASSQLFYSLNDYVYAKIFLGAGPSFFYSFSKSQSDNTSFTDSTKYFSSYEDRNKQYGIGIMISLLIRSHIYQSIYLVTEYRFSGYYKWVTEDYNSNYYTKYSYQTQPDFSNNQRTLKNKGWKLEFSTIKVGLLIEL